MTRAVVIGSVTVDERPRPGGGLERRVGGTATYGAAALRAEGLEVLSVCNLGGPDGAAARRVLERLGIVLAAGASPATTTFRAAPAAPAPLRSTGTTVEPPAAAEGGVPEGLELIERAAPIRGEQCAAALEGAALVHLGPLHGEDLDASAIAAADAAPAVVGLDAQGLLRSSGPGPVRAEPSPLLGPALAAARLLKLAGHEAEALERAWSLGLEAIVSDAGIEETLVTRGVHGGAALVAGRRHAWAAAPARSGDPTGAGDVFFATYLASRRVHGRGVADSLERAARRAAEQVAGAFLAPEALRLR